MPAPNVHTRNLTVARNEHSQNDCSRDARLTCQRGVVDQVQMHGMKLRTPGELIVLKTLR